MEVMTVIGIVGILAAIAIPSYIGMLPKIRLKTSSRDLYSNMQKAKMEAIKRNREVAISFDVPNSSYTVFIDDGNGGGNAGDSTQNGTEQTLATGRMLAGVTILNAAFGATVPPAASFKPQGLPKNQGSVTIQNSTKTYTVTVTSAGAIRLQ